MPLWKCQNCHHEWEGSNLRAMCDWCGGDGEKLAENTELELTLAANCETSLRRGAPDENRTRKCSARPKCA